MMKKKLLLGVLVASVLITSALCLNACKKNSDEEVVPTEVTVMRGSIHYAICAHCTDTLWDRNWYCLEPLGPHWPMDDPRVFHIHEYQIGDQCALVTNGGWCRYNLMHHRHEIFYEIDPINGNDHYQDDWIHIGGGGGGE